MFNEREDIELIKIETHQLEKMVFPNKKGYLLCELQKGTAKLIRENTQTISESSVFILDLTKKNILVSTNEEPLSFLTIEFLFSGFPLDLLLTHATSITELQKSLLTSLQLETQKNFLIQRSKPSLTHDKEIATYYTVCQKNSQQLLKQLLLLLLENELFQTLPTDYKQHIAHLSENNKQAEQENVYSKKAHIRCPNSFINDVIDFLNDHLADNLTIDLIAQNFYTSSANLKKQFKKTTNKSIISYFNELRMIQAQQWIRENELSYTEIAKRLGFNSIHHFSAAFKKYSGHSPSSYYKSLQPGYVETVDKTVFYFNQPWIM
jgi:AraC-type DNA-binding domain-containing proteins